jgi:hypothetical protein
MRRPRLRAALRPVNLAQSFPRSFQSRFVCRTSTLSQSPTSPSVPLRQGDKSVHASLPIPQITAPIAVRPLFARIPSSLCGICRQICRAWTNSCRRFADVSGGVGHSVKNNPVSQMISPVIESNCLADCFQDLQHAEAQV